MGINPASLMKVMSMKNQFENSHPKFCAFIGTLFHRGVEEGAVIEITITHVDGSTTTGNMRVTAEDLALVNELKTLNQ